MPRMADGRVMPPTFVCLDLDSFGRLDELDLQVMGQRLEPGRAALACWVIETDEFAGGVKAADARLRCATA
jgi:hypothetical protein